jgi:hypothetical protein
MASASDRIVVVGASAGGVRALPALAAQLEADFPAPLLVVLHVGSNRSILPSLLSRAGRLPATPRAARHDLAGPHRRRSDVARVGLARARSVQCCERSTMSFL